MLPYRVCTATVIASILLTDSGWAQTDSWQTLSEVKPEAAIVIYLKNGGRMKQTLISYDKDRIVTDAGDVARKDIAAISLFRPERLWDGTLRGGAIGVGVLMIPAIAEGNAEGAAGATVISFLAGVGLGALFDAGVARPDKPIFANTGGQPPSLRNWKLQIPHQHLATWLKRQRVQLMLKDGTYVHGTVLGGTETSLEMDVRESSMPKLQGSATVDAAEVATVIFRQKLGGSTAAATTGGAISGFWSGFGAGVAADPYAGEGVVAAALGGALAGAVLAGIGIDHMNHREITLVVE